MTKQILTLDQCPADIRAHFLAMPSYQNEIRITKADSVDKGDKSHVVKTLKTGHREPAKKAANLPGFAAILGGSVSRNIGTPAPAIPVAPAPTTAPTDAILSRSNITTRGSNVPKEPMRAERGNPVTYSDLQQAVDAAMAERHKREESERFNASRSAYSRITPTKESDVQGGGSGDAWSLRNFGGKLAAAVLNGTARKAESPLPDNSAWRPMTGATLK